MSNENTYTVERIKVSELEVDRRVQRDGLQMGKVDKIVQNFNPDAVGVVHVARRLTENGSHIGYYIIDGAHRTEAMRRKTENTGEMVCFVYEGLTLEQEAQMFLDLNFANQPTPLEKHKNRVVAHDPQALRVEEAVHAYGWKISPVPLNGNVNAIQRLYSMDAQSERIHAEPNLISATFLIITRAWGTDRYGAQSVLLDGIAQLVAEYGLGDGAGARIKLDRLVDRLKEYPGGPRGLHKTAADFAALRHGSVAMAVAELITDWYNKGFSKDSKQSLPTWRKRKG